MASRDDKCAALAVRFQDGEFSEDVYRASLFCTGLRGSDLESIIREQQEICHAAKKHIS